MIKKNDLTRLIKLFMLLIKISMSMMNKYDSAPKGGYQIMESRGFGVINGIGIPYKYMF